jgi:O-methyltransferase
MNNKEITKAEAIDTLRKSSGSFYGSEGLYVSGRNLSFTQDKRFIDLYSSLAEDQKEKGRLWRLHVFIWSFMNGLKLDGDLVELGVYRGFSSAVAVRYSEFQNYQKTLYLFDTWDGIPNDQLDTGRAPIDKYKDPANYEKVVTRFADYKNVKLVKGRVPESFSTIKMPEKISFLHVDMNSSIAEIGALNALWDNLVPGAICLLDDFGLLIAREQMINETVWFNQKDYLVCELPTSQGIVIKR